MEISPEAYGSTAVLVVDMQNGFCHRQGTLGTSKLGVGLVEPIVPRISALVEAAHAAGLPVLWSRQEHTEHDVTRPRHRVRTHLAKLDYVPCLRGTWDAALLDELQAIVGDDDLVFPKHRASCFHATTLDLELRMRGIDTLIITGVSSNYCVDSTIRDAYARDYDLYIVEDACACPWQDLHDATMKTAAIFHGEVVATADVLAALATVAEARAAA